MRVVFFLISIFLLTSNLIANEWTRSIFGKDNRVEMFKVTDPKILELSRSVAAQMYNTSLIPEGESHHRTFATTLEEAGVCSWERFAEQMQASRCTGFLVAPDLIVTAGHCIINDKECTRFKWVFGYRKSDDKKDILIKNEDIYSCVEVVEQKLDEVTLNDYALIRLDRSVKNRKSLKFRTEGKIEMGEKLFVMGYPDKLPLKFADDASVKKNNASNYFTTNLDTFSGNSGSPVFNSKTHLVEGVLVRGGLDYIYTIEECWKLYTCKDIENCSGEDVTRITEIEGIK